MAFFGNKRKDFSIQPPKQQVDGTPFYVTDSANIDFTFANLNLTANLTQLLPTSGTYGDSTHIPILQIDQFGRVTEVTTTTFSASGIALEVNGTPNLSQTILNLTSGTDIQVVDLGGGVIEFNYIGTAGTAAWGSIATGTGVGSQTDLVTYLNSNYYPLAGNPSGFLTTAVTSVGLSMPSAFTVTVSPITSTGLLTVVGAGTTSQYVRGDGTLATYNPGTGGGGASVSYYLNGSVSQGTFGGVAFKQMSKTPVFGAGTDFTINADGYIQSFITDAGTPNQLLIPAGNWNFETYFSASSGGGSPSFYVQIYKWNGTTLTLIANNSATPEAITGGTAIDLYTTAVGVPQITLLATDRIAIRIYVTHSGRTITLHTEDSHLCQVITTFSTGITALNGLTDQVQNFATPGTTGTAPNWNSVSPTHTLNIPLASTASVTAGLISNTNFNTFNGKQDALTLTTTGTSGAATLVGATLNIPQYSGGSGGNSIQALTGDVTASASSPSQSVAATLAANLKIGSFGVTVDGVSSTIQVGQTGFVVMPYAGTITGWSITTNASGSIQFGVWKAAGAIPTVANSIVASAPPTLTSAQFVTSTTLTGWTTTFAAGDVFGFYVNSVSSTVKNATLTIRCTKT